MSATGNAVGRTASTRAPDKSAWPARLDLLQSLSGLLLAAFLAVHLLLDSAILIGPGAADFVARFFEGEHLFGSPQPWIVSAAALGLLALLVVHAALAMRKFPHAHRDYMQLREHVRTFGHADTRLWWWQALTGFALFFLVSAHLIIMITQPEAIGAEPSTFRIVQQGAWVFYLALLPIVLVHAAVGVYRLSVKWGVPPLANAMAAERRRVAMWIVTAMYLALGLASLATYVYRGLAG
ncbi:MAG: fumarate reductase cytochrome b subunit [Gammaproteobacteria bacterium]|nr:fumarate reductase cytochrome b subunit [Gammaproteobacteria bacterium]